MIHQTKSRGTATRRRSPGSTRAVATLLVLLLLLLAACSSGHKTVAPAATTTTRVGFKDPGAVSGAGCPASPTTGIIGSTIKIGTSLPETGSAGSGEILAGEQAYFDYLNKVVGGVAVGGKRYQIQLVAKDDRGEPATTAANATQLVRDDKVFALFNVVGTDNNLAIRQQLASACVPDLFAASGSPAWGNPKYPWLLGAPLVPYSLETQSFIDYLKRNRTHTTLAVLHSSDDVGSEYFASLRAQAVGTSVSIVKDAATGANIAAQVAGLAKKKADAFVVAATPAACATALTALKATGWAPITYVPSSCITKALAGLAGADGIITTSSFMDPSDPEWATNPQMLLYKEKVHAYAPAADVSRAATAYGWTAAALLVEIFKRSPALDRVSVMNTAHTLGFLTGIGLLNPGVVMSTARGDNFLAESYTLMRYSTAKGYLTPFGQVQIGDGLTGQFTLASQITR